MKWWYQFVPVVIGFAIMVVGMLLAGPEPELSPRLWAGVALSWGGAAFAILGSMALKP